MNPSLCLYLLDEQALAAEATVAAVCDNALAFDQTCFYPGGGGQPPDAGEIILSTACCLEIVSAHADKEGVVWHVASSTPTAVLPGQRVRMEVNAQRRQSLSRYHTVLHVLNTVALRDYGGWITGAQIAVDYSRIDFKIDGFLPALCAELEAKVNAVLAGEHPVSARYISADEFRQRDDLRRTLDVSPPVRDGRVRVVEIHGFDAQACGGTHVTNTSEIGHFTISRSENKGKKNKRLYVRLDPTV